jgi:hypothetical protein
MARDALRSNNEKVERAERILSLAELGRKLETEREKATTLILAPASARVFARPLLSLP